MVAQNKHNSAGIEVGLDAMWKQPFGEHYSCSDWYTQKQDPPKQYKHLPFGQCLKYTNLEKALADILRSKKALREDIWTRFDTGQGEHKQLYSI